MPMKKISVLLLFFLNILAPGNTKAEVDMYQLGREFAHQETEEKRRLQQIADARYQWWSANKATAKPLMEDYNNCILSNISNAHTNLAVRQIRKSCLKLHWPDGWPENYVDGP